MFDYVENVIEESKDHDPICIEDVEGSSKIVSCLV